MACNSVLSCTIVIVAVCGWTTINALGTELLYTITCDSSSFEADCQNETLDTILNGIEGEYDVHIDIETSQLQLNKVINITGLNSLTVIGKLDVQTSIICTTSQNLQAMVLYCELYMDQYSCIT